MDWSLNKGRSFVYYYELDIFDLIIALEWLLRVRFASEKISSRVLAFFLFLLYSNEN